MNANSTFRRPGVTDEFLAAAGCEHVGEADCLKSFGFRAEGIAIPFRHLTGSPVMDGDGPFARVRLYHATNAQKYHQRRGSGVHIYIPPTFIQSPKGSRLLLVEGEFKSLALAEAGYAALGLCGFTGAARALTGADGERTHALIDELIALLKMHQPAEVVFLGDADVALNGQFAIEAAKLRPLLCGSRQFQFIEKFTSAKLPIDGPKGVDDFRAEKGEVFPDCFENILSTGYDVPTKASGAEVFVALLRRETKAIKHLVTQQDHEGSRARVRLLQSAGQLWSEPGAPLELKPLLAELLGVSKSEAATLVRDATSKKWELENGEAERKNATQGSAVDFPDVEPWPESVNGSEVLHEVAAVFARYVALPPGAADALALWTAHAHAFDAFLYTPRLNLYSPEKGCGKTTALDVLASMTPRPLRTESMTAAVLFRLVEAHRPTLLLDEVDAYLNEAEELRGLLNAGHKRGAKAYRCEGENNTVRGFAAFAPAALAGIGALPGTLHDRSIVVKLLRAKSGEIMARFDSRRTEHEAELCRKLAKWTADNFAKLKSCEPQLPETAFNRLGDKWRPLFAIAEVVGGDWPRRTAEAFAKLTSSDDLDAHGIGTTLLADIRVAFAVALVEKLPSAALVDALIAFEGREWAEWGKHKKPISVNQLAKLLRRFDVAPHTIRIGGETAKGYALADFAEAFERFLPKSLLSDRNTVTNPENTVEHCISEASQPQSVLRSGKAISTNTGAGCDDVTVQKLETVEVAENARLL